MGLEEEFPRELQRIIRASPKHKRLLSECRTAVKRHRADKRMEKALTSSSDPTICKSHQEISDISDQSTSPYDSRELGAIVARYSDLLNEHEVDSFTEIVKAYLLHQPNSLVKFREVTRALQERLLLNSGVKPCDITIGEHYIMQQQ